MLLVRFNIQTQYLIATERFLYTVNERLIFKNSAIDRRVVKLIVRVTTILKDI